MKNEDLMRTKEASEYVGLGQSTLERFRIKGNGPKYCKLGGAVRYRRADLDTWLEASLINSTSETSD
jgi:excisionase family DNA binding protein